MERVRVEGQLEIFDHTKVAEFEKCAICLDTDVDMQVYTSDGVRIRVEFTHTSVKGPLVPQKSLVYIRHQLSDHVTSLRRRVDEHLEMLKTNEQQGLEQCVLYLSTEVEIHVVSKGASTKIHFVV